MERASASAAFNQRQNNILVSRTASLLDADFLADEGLVNLDNFSSSPPLAF